MKIHSHFGIYGYFKKDNSILLIKKARGPYKGMYDLPGGSPAENELNESTLRREIKEETGLDLLSYKKFTEEAITLFYTYTINNKKYLLRHSALLYVIDNYEGHIKCTSDGEDSYGSKWVDVSKINRNKLTPFVRFFIDSSSIYNAT